MANKYQMNPEDQARPLAFPSPNIHPITDYESDGGEPRRSSFQYLRKRRFALWCCGCCGTIVVLLGLVILILAFTVFKVKDPELTMNAIQLDHLFVPGIGSLENPLSINATLIADVSIKNPNVASFKFGNSSTGFSYKGQTVGVAYAPGGNVKGRRTVRMNVTVDVLVDRVLMDTDIAGQAAGDGRLNMSSFTDIYGRVNLLGIYKRDIEIMLNCTFQLGVLDSSLSNKNCIASVK